MRYGPICSPAFMVLLRILQPAFLDPPRIIQPQNADRHFSGFSQRANRGALQTKVIGPGLPSRIEQSHRLSGCAQRGDVGSLVPVADGAGQSEVVRAGVPAMLPADDVIDLMTVAAEVFAQQAILATPARAFGHQAPDIAGNRPSHPPRSDAPSLSPCA